MHEHASAQADGYAHVDDAPEVTERRAAHGRVASEMTPLTIGRHRGQRTGDLLELQVHGVLTMADLTTLRTTSIEVLAQHGRCFLIGDVTEMTGFDAEARRVMASWNRTEPLQLSGAVVYGCGFAMRTLITLTLNAINYFLKQPMETVFVRDAAEAHAWVNTRRAALEEEEVQHGI